MRLSDEQLAVLQSNKQHLTVNAGPGTGKTTLLLNIAKHRPNEKHLILCFNSTIKEEIKEKLQKQEISNAEVFTFHSLAFNFFLNNNIIPNFKKRNFDENLDFFSLFEIMKELEITDVYYSYKLRDVLEALPKYLSSNKKLNEIEVEEETIENIKLIMNYIVNNPKAPMFHEVYIKMYQLMNPQVDFDSILVDEFQDVSPCYLSIIENISKDKRSVRVGDTYQKIYGYNGAIGMDSCDFKLTQSFRIGKEISNYCNNMLENFFEEPIKLNGCNQTASFGKIENRSFTKIFRTNKALLVELINLLLEGKKVKVSSKIISEFDFYSKFLDLNKTNKYYKGIKIVTIEDLERLYEMSKDRKISKFLFLTENFSNEQLKKAISKIEVNLISEDEDSDFDVHLITSHRCKGLEFSAVKIADDFPTLDKLQELSEEGEDAFDEIYILFVALTRSNGILEL